jgi:hypothetical protein
MMKKLSYFFAALATIAFAAPAFAEDKPMMKEGMHEGMHRGHMHRGMTETRRHYHHRHHHHMMKEGM